MPLYCRPCVSFYIYGQCMTDQDISAPQHAYAGLSPDVVMDAVETGGFQCTGAILPLNSYENRVYKIELEGQAPVIAKFYRPERWADEAILEEHAFSLELHEREIPVVAPMTLANGRTLNRYAGFRFALFPCQGGRAPEMNDPEDFVIMGRFLGRIHAVGAMKPFQYRPQLSIEHFGHESLAFLLQCKLIPQELLYPYESLVRDLLTEIEAVFASCRGVKQIRLHGDCHLGNVLWTENGPHFVDLDDCRSGPAVQDIWMLLSGDRQSMTIQLADIMDGYREFYDFDSRELQLIESLRTLRMIHYSAWLARRWDDPAFPMHFPWFAEQRYWEEQILSLREQFALIQEPALVCY